MRVSITYALSVEEWPRREFCPFVIRPVPPCEKAKVGGANGESYT